GLEGLGIRSPPGYPGREDLNVLHGSRGAANPLFSALRSRRGRSRLERFCALSLAARRLAGGALLLPISWGGGSAAKPTRRRGRFRGRDCPSTATRSPSPQSGEERRRTTV